MSWFQLQARVPLLLQGVEVGLVRDSGIGCRSPHHLESQSTGLLCSQTGASRRMGEDLYGR